MTKIKLQGSFINTRGNLPHIGDVVEDFIMVKPDLTEVNLYSFKGHKILNIFPSIDTDVCAMSVRKFNKEATDLGDTVVINLSMDLPFAQKRFCGAEGIKNVEIGSLFRSDFFKHYPIDIIDGPLKGLCSRAILVLNEKNEVTYNEQVYDISHEPNYELALEALKI